MTVRALVSATDVMAVLAIHADRVHDAARRLGGAADEAVEITEESAVELIEALHRRPESVGDLVGGLYGRCRLLAERVQSQSRLGLSIGQTRPSAGPTSLLQEAEQSTAVEAALDVLPEQRRLALLLRDSYGLTLGQAAIAIAVDPAETARTVALGRLDVAARVDRRDVPSMTGHDLAVGDLGQLSDGSLPPGGRYATLRRHVSGCAICAGVLDLQTRGRALVGTLPILALPDEERTALLRRCESRAVDVLPTAAHVQAELAGDLQRPRVVSPLLVVGAVLLAALLGGGIGLLLSNSPQAALNTGNGAPLAVATVSTASSLTLPTTGPTPSTFASRDTSPAPSTPPPATLSTSASATPSTKRSPSPSSTQTAAPNITLSPTSGPSGTPVTVHGSGFIPGATVQISYQGSGPPTAQTSAPVAADGTFTASITAADPSLLSSPLHTVTATDGKHTAGASFTQT